MSDIFGIYFLYAAAGALAVYDRGSMAPVVMALMATAYRISIAIEGRRQ